MYKSMKAPIHTVIIMFLMTLAFPMTTFAKPSKVDVCHWDADQGTFKLLNISEKALKAHLKQGGVLPSTNGLDENCNPLPDNDGDGIPDVDDVDDDNDGQTDVDEIACGSDPLDAGSMAADFDGDSSPDCVDPDDDNDGVNDGNDAFPFDASESNDNDGDEIGDNADPDDDNDGIDDVNDPFPFDPTQPRSLGCQAANQVPSRTMSPGERWVPVTDNFYGGERPTFHINSPIQSGGFSLYLYIEYGNTDITGLDYVTQPGSYTIPVSGSGTQHVQLEMRYLGILGDPVEVGVSCQ